MYRRKLSDGGAAGLHTSSTCGDDPLQRSKSPPRPAFSGTPLQRSKNPPRPAFSGTPLQGGENPPRPAFSGTPLQRRGEPTPSRFQRDTPPRRGLPARLSTGQTPSRLFTARDPDEVVSAGHLRAKSRVSSICPFLMQGQSLSAMTSEPLAESTTTLIQASRKATA